MNQATQDNLKQSLIGIANALGKSDPSQINETDVCNVIDWIKNPTHQYPNGQTGNQLWQGLTAAFSQTNNVISALQQGAQAQEQFAGNEFTQFMNLCKDLFSASQELNRNVINNQKSQ